MNMNKKINLIIIFIITLFLININVMASCLSPENQKSPEICNDAQDNGFKCRWMTAGGRSQCVKSDECITGFVNQNGVCVADASNNNNENNEQ